MSLSLRPERRHFLDGNTKRIARYDGGTAYLTCECGEAAEVSAGSMAEHIWWNDHKPGHPYRRPQPGPFLGQAPVQP